MQSGLHPGSEILEIHLVAGIKRRINGIIIKTERRQAARRFSGS